MAAVNITDHPITLASKVEVARLSVMTAEQFQNLTVIDPQLVAFSKQKLSESTIAEINQLIQNFADKGRTSHSKRNLNMRNFGFQHHKPVAIRISYLPFKKNPLAKSEGYNAQKN